MKLLYLHIIFCLLLVSNTSFSQFEVGTIFEELPSDKIYKNSTELHTSFKPFIRQNTFEKSDSIKKYFHINPALDLNGGYSQKANYRVGAGLNLTSQVGKWYFRLGAIGGLGTIDSVFNTRSFYYEEKNNDYYYTDIRGRVSFTPNEIFNFQAGLDNHFIGEGSRSLFLSDYGVPHPFGQIRAKFWRLEYTVLYQFMRERLAGSWKSKYATSHHISLNATKWLNFGIFETVLFQPKDTLLNRGYDVEYLNPVIFFRPQEYSLGSADNILIGVSMDAKFNNQMLYSQFILDEFNLAEIRNNPSWWANKYGLQVGIKGRFHPTLGSFFYRFEYNMMRPYMYSHVNEMQTFGNQGHVLAHPLGANFHELLAELKWQKGNYLIKFFTTYRLKGEDKNGFSYGGNIYLPYTLRPDDYGHFTGQGRGKNTSRTIITFDYQVYKKAQLHLFFENHLLINGNTSKVDYIPIIGIRSQLWNDYRNY